MINIGIEFDELVIDENLLALALDMLGVPADTTDEYPELDSYSDGPLPKGWFCRDWYGDAFDRIVQDGTLLQCLEYVRRVRERMENMNIRVGV